MRQDVYSLYQTAYSAAICIIFYTSVADLSPIILVPGLTGSRLQAVNRNTGQTVECWVPRICLSMWDTMAKFLWGFYSEEQGRYVSWCEPEWSIRAVPGIVGVEWLSGQVIKRFPIISK